MTPFHTTGRLILAVDDEPVVLRSVTTALAMGGGFMVIVAENGLAGLDAFQRYSQEIDLVLTDIVMPFLDGLQMVERIKKIRPDVPILLMTGYSDGVISTLSDIEYPLIRKPFLAEDLVRAARASIAPPAAEA